MRRRVTWLVALFVGLLVASSSSAETCRIAGHTDLEGQFGLDLGYGLAVPLGQLGDVALVQWSGAPVGDTGLDAHGGWTGSVGADYYMNSFMSAGLWFDVASMHMRDQNVYTPTRNAWNTYYALLDTRTTMIGLRAKGYLPMPGPWSPYAAVGLTHFHRIADLSHALTPLDPSNPIYRITDNGMGFDLGAGFEHRVTKDVGLGMRATYYFSGAFGHDLPWMGRERIVHNWEFWTADAHLTVHVPGVRTR